MIEGVSAVFDLPEEFVNAYRAEIDDWGRNLRRWGPFRRIMLRRIPGQPVVLDGNGEAPMLAVELRAWPEKKDASRLRLRVYPMNDVDEAVMRRHVEDIRRWGPPEPPRAEPRAPGLSMRAMN